MSDKQECHRCRWFDPMECYCFECEIFCHGHDGARCEFYEGWKKNDEEEKRQSVRPNTLPDLV